MASEWEELEKLTKDELIIELVHYRNMYGMLREKLPEDGDPPYLRRKHTGEGESYEPGEPTTEEWAVKIALYCAKHPKDGAFYPCDLLDYGLDSEQGYDICSRLRAEGRLNLPEGVEYAGERSCPADASPTSRPRRSGSKRTASSKGRISIAATRTGPTG